MPDSPVLTPSVTQGLLFSRKQGFIFNAVGHGLARGWDMGKDVPRALPLGSGAWMALPKVDSGTSQKGLRSRHG